VPDAVARAGIGTDERLVGIVLPLLFDGEPGPEEGEAGVIRDDLRCRRILFASVQVMFRHAANTWRCLEF
jgi:hypothetical protein